MKKLCNALAIITFVLGLVGSFILAKNLGRTLVYSSTKYNITEYERSWGLTIGIFLGCMFSVVVLSAILWSLAEIMKRLEILEQATAVTMYKVSSESSTSVKDGWVCPNCGTTNYSYVTTCKCGTKKEVVPPKATNNSKNATNGKWICPECGELNECYETYCKCGKGKQPTFTPKA